MRKGMHLSLILLIFYVFLFSACNPKISITQTPIQQSTSTSKPTSTQTPSPTPKPTSHLFEGMTNFVIRVGDAWASQDPDEIVPLYSEDIKAFDASSYEEVVEYPEVVQVINNYFRNGKFVWDITSFFIADDYRIAGLVGTFKIRSFDEYTTLPAFSLNEIKNDQIIWEFDYYGSAMSDIYTIPEIPISASLDTASEEEIEKTKLMITEWENAYNNEDINAFLSFYSDQATCSYLISPEWIVLTKNQMLDDLNDKFTNERLRSEYQDFFLSENGQFAAIQGVYEVLHNATEPIIILLEIKGFKIIREYVFLENRLRIIGN